MGYSARDVKTNEAQAQPLQSRALPGTCINPEVSKASRDTAEIILLWGLSRW